MTSRPAAEGACSRQPAGFVFLKGSRGIQRKAAMKQNTATDAQYRRMTEAPIPGLILSLCIPSIITSMITSIYNMVDTFFVAQLGTAAVAAVGVVFSISSVISALGFWMGTGSSSLVSLQLGARQQETADRTASMGFYLSMAMGGVIAVGGLLFLRPLMRLLGSTPTILPEACRYALPLLLGAPFQCSNLALSQNLRAEGMSRESMAGQLAGGMLNMVLDPLFIFGLGWGVFGAGVATALSQAVVWAALLQYYVRKKTVVRLSPRNLRMDGALLAGIFSAGFPSLCRHCGNALSSVVLNRAAGAFGDTVIAAFSVATRVTGLALSVSIGFVQAIQPVAGYAHGSKNHKRLREAYDFTVAASVAALTVIAAAIAFFARPIMFLLHIPEETVSVSVAVLRFSCVALPFTTLVNCTGTLFQAIKESTRSSIIVLGRQVCVYVPLLILLSHFWGMSGLMAALPAADAFSCLVAAVMARSFFAKLSAGPPSAGSSSAGIGPAE